MAKSHRPLRIALLSAAVLLALLTGGSAVYAQQLTGQDMRTYQVTLAGLRADRAAAAKDGFTSQDLAAVDSQIATVTAQAAPGDPWQGPSFYRSETSQLAALRQQLGATEAAVRQDAVNTFQLQLANATSALQRDSTLGLPDDQVAAFQSTFEELAGGTSLPIGLLRIRTSQLESLAQRITAAGDGQQQENLAIDQAAAALATQAASDPKGVKTTAAAALAAGRNDASVAAYEDRTGRFPAMAEMQDDYDRLERFGSELFAPDSSKLALIAAGLQHYSAKIHDLLMQNLGPQHIVVSFQDQHVWVYQGGKVVMDSAVTTGIRGVTDYGTDFGPMKVLNKQHPFKFHSPYPPGSRYWYPDTWVQWTVFFTDSGESFHDASWEPDSELGPGSQFNPATRSHGCIHIPYAKAEWLYNWANIGTPVDVVPFDGQPVATQLAEITTDNQGNPLNPA